MAIARAQLVDASLTRWYHCVTRCARCAFLLGEGDHNRKEWIEDRRGLDSTREGMVQGIPLGSYVKLVDCAGRLFRQGKASISAELAAIIERLGCSSQSWLDRMEKLGKGRLLGRFFATTRAKLREISERLGVRHVVNLAGCPVR